MIRPFSFSKVLWPALVFCVALSFAQAGSSQNYSPSYAFSERLIDSVHDLYQGAELDHDILMVFADFHQESDLAKNVEFQKRIQALADKQKGFFEKARKNLEGSANWGSPIQQAISQNASSAIFDLLIKNQMFTDVLQGRKDHSPEDYRKMEKEGWEQLLVAVRQFPYLVSEKKDSEKPKGAIFYTISKQERDSLLKRLDQYFGDKKTEMAAGIKASYKNPAKPPSVIHSVVLKLYESLQFDTYKEYRNKTVTDPLFK